MQKNIHLNEDGLIIEKQWIDEKRFIPIITDLRRNVQPIIRYKMNDILHTTDCSCGSKMLAISAIEGRMDDLLTISKDKVIFPDFIRRAITGANSEIDQLPTNPSVRSKTQFVCQSNKALG